MGALLCSLRISASFGLAQQFNTIATHRHQPWWFPPPSLFNTRSCQICLCIPLFFAMFQSKSPTIRAPGDQFKHRRITSKDKSSHGKVSPYPTIASNVAGSMPIPRTTSFTSGTLDTCRCSPSFVVRRHHLISPPSFSTSTRSISAAISSAYDIVTPGAYPFRLSSLVFNNNLASSLRRPSFSVSTMLTIRFSQLSINSMALRTTSRLFGYLITFPGHDKPFN